MTRIVAALMLVVMLAGCTIVQPVVRDGLNEVGESLNVLSYGPASIVVTPPDVGLHGLILDVQGVALTVTHDACTVVQVGHVQCNWGVVMDEVIVPTTGVNVTATGTYRLAGEYQVRHEILAGP